MNKFIIILLFFCVTIHAQDSLTLVKQTTIQYTEKNIKVDNNAVFDIKFNPNFKEKYKSSEFQYEVKITEKGIWDRFIDWLTSIFKNIFGFTNGISTNAVNITIRTFCVLLVVFVVYLIVKSILNKEGQWIFGKSTTKKIISYDDIERNLKYIDFEKLIIETIKNGNNRLAIRYYYMWILKKMSEKSIIDWNPEKTNSDYLYEIQSENLRKEFNYVSYLYNNIWYGEFDVENETFESAKKAFIKTLQSI